MDKQVKRTLKVGIYGSRLVMSAIGASLHEKPGFEVQKIESSAPNIIGKLDVAPPDVTLFDLAATQPHEKPNEERRKHYGELQENRAHRSDEARRIEILRSRVGSWRVSHRGRDDRLRSGQSSGPRR